CPNQRALAAAGHADDGQQTAGRQAVEHLVDLAVAAKEPPGVLLLEGSEARGWIHADGGGHACALRTSSTKPITWPTVDRASGCFRSLSSRSGGARNQLRFAPGLLSCAFSQIGSRRLRSAAPS